MGASLAYGISKSSANRLPPLDGKISLPCLDGEGSIVYDKWGIPHIYASSRKDGYRLQGFVTAQHRCFQLVQTQLAIRGELSKIIGPPAKSIDIFSRTCNFNGLAKADWEYVAKNKNKYKKTIDMVQSYVEGINAWYSHPLFEKPVELSAIMLNYNPEFWTESDVFGVSRLLGIRMSLGWNSKMLQTLLIQIVGYKNAEWFCFDSSKMYECPYNDTDKDIADFYLKLKDIGRLLEKQYQPIMGMKHSYFNNQKAYVSPNKYSLYTDDNDDNDVYYDDKQDVKDDPNNVDINILDPMKPGQGSNAWVVSGKYTDCGKPILANDPHLTLNIPNSFVYYHVTINSNDDNKQSDENIHFTGVQCPGLPAIVIGHTEYCAWGITLGVCDTSDIFIERFENKDSNKYQVDGKWKECTIRREIIQIKGENDYILYVRSTENGPILTPTDYDNGIQNGPYSHLLSTNINTNTDDNDKYYLRYSFCATYLKDRKDIDSTPIEIFNYLLESKNIFTFSSYLRQISFPNLNFIIADNNGINGNYGWTSNGLIPIRGDMLTYNPLLPQPGWLSQYKWNKYIPRDELPISINPQKGYIVSCNNNMVNPDKYPYYLGFSFAIGFRAKRASQLIDNQIMNKIKINIDFYKKMQTDVHDLCAKEFINNIMNSKKIDLNNIIQNYLIKFDFKCKYKLDYNDYILNKCIPKEIRNNSDITIDYYNNKENRLKAEYAANILNKWDYEYTLDSIGATIYDSFITVLLRRLILTGIYRGYIDPLQRNTSNSIDDDKKEDNIHVLKKYAELLGENILRNTHNRVFSGLSSFFYKRIMPAFTMLNGDINNNCDCWWINNYINCENIIIISLIDCIDCIKYWTKTDDKNKWKWGNVHEIEVFHPISAKLGSKPFNSKIYPQKGGFYCLNMMRPNLESIKENPLKCIRSAVPVWRQIIDCNDWTKSICVLPMGTSGQVGSPYYQNLLKPYVDEEYIPMLWTKQQVDDNKISQLICDPLRNINDDDQSFCKIL